MISLTFISINTIMKIVISGRIKKEQANGRLMIICRQFGRMRRASRLLSE